MLFAEFLGTAILVFIGCGSIMWIDGLNAATVLQIALTFGLTIATLVQVNPNASNRPCFSPPNASNRRIARTRRPLFDCSSMSLLNRLHRTKTRAVQTDRVYTTAWARGSILYMKKNNNNCTVFDEFLPVTVNKLLTLTVF